jgi:DNA-binding MarR family transcriptional regulator
MHPMYLGWQVDWPVFIKVPFPADNKFWKRGEHFNWAERDLDPYKVSILYSTGYIYHNSELEVSSRVGDRLNEMDQGQLDTLVDLLNSKVKELSTSSKEAQDKRCRKSKITEKQRGLIRRFLNSNSWIKEDFYDYRDRILGE